MRNISVTKEQALYLIASEETRADVRVFGALAAAVILMKEKRSEFDADMLGAISPMVDWLHDEIHFPVPATPASGGPRDG